MDERPQPPAKKKTKSDVLRDSTVSEYMLAHTKTNGGWKSFFHSNLFTALVLFFLAQAVTVGSIIVALYYRMETFLEWKGEAIATFKRMDDLGTVHSHFADERQDKDITDLQARMKKSEEEGRQWEVIKTEHRRLTEDVEELRHGKK